MLEVVDVDIPALIVLHVLDRNYVLADNISNRFCTALFSQTLSYGSSISGGFDAFMIRIIYKYTYMDMCLHSISYNSYGKPSTVYALIPSQAVYRNEES